MARLNLSITPVDRVDRWKKLWATPRRLDQAMAELAFEEFTEMLVPTHMHKLFLKTFGQPRAHFGNRFFKDSAQFHEWGTRLSTLGAGESSRIEVTVIYASPESMEAHELKGETRRTLKDIFIDDWHTSIAIVRSPTANFYLFIQPKSSGCIVKTVPLEKEEGIESEL